MFGFNPLRRIYVTAAIQDTVLAARLFALVAVMVLSSVSSNTSASIALNAEEALINTFMADYRITRMLWSKHAHYMVAHGISCFPVSSLTLVIYDWCAL